MGQIVNMDNGKTLKAGKCPVGYPRVTCKKDNGSRSGLFVHRAIAMTFIPNPKNKPSVNHKDANKENFSIDNLEWCTHQENMKHAFKHGLMNGFLSASRSQAKIKRNEMWRKLSDLGYTHHEISEAFGCSQPNVTRVLSA
jgi:hypothetical protein